MPTVITINNKGKQTVVDNTIVPKTDYIERLVKHRIVIPTIPVAPIENQVKVETPILKEENREVKQLDINTVNFTDLASYYKAELIALCEQAKTSTDGTKADLIARLLDWKMKLKVTE